MNTCELFFLIYDVILLLYAGQADKGDILSAKELLRTISPEYHTPELPPGFPPLELIETNKFNYKTSKDYDRVSALLPTPVDMYPDYVQLSNVGINFTYIKTGPTNGTWQVDVQGTWMIGSTLIPVTILDNGGITAEAKSISLNDLISAFLIQKENVEIGIEASAIVLSDMKLHARVSRKQTGMRAVFNGIFKTKSFSPTKIKITAIKNNFSKMQLFSVMQFRHARPEKVLKEILNEKILTIPFFAHMLTSSDLFFKRKDVFGLTFSFNEVYHYKEHTMAGRIIRTVLQSHIPVGITLLSHMRILSEIKSARKFNHNKRSGSLMDDVKVAFVINEPAFDLLLSQKDKILVSQLLPVLSKELSTTDRMQRFNRSLKKAYTTHVSFDSSSTVFSIFVRLKESFQLISSSLRINVTNLVLQRNIGLDDKKLGWKASAKGIYCMGGQRIRVKYSELTDDPGESFGLTGSTNQISLEDIFKEFSPKFYPNAEVKTMVENTEIESLKLHKVRIYSRGSDLSTTPHILITGLANLPEWEKEIQVALLLLQKNGKWFCKWAASLKNSPLSNILQALTGFDSRNLKILHNNHIITTIISSPLPPYSLLPSYIITTRLLRLPVQKALTVVALLPFPDNCGDDKMCESATGLLDTSKVYTLSGVLSMKEYVLRARLPHVMNISDIIIGENNTLQFRIGNNSKMDITTSFKIPGSNFIFDGALYIYQSGLIEIDATSRTKRWISPFGMKSLIFENMKLNTIYKKKSSLTKLSMSGNIKLGLKDDGSAVVSKVLLNYDVHNPFKSNFAANFSDITLPKLLRSYSINVRLPNVLHNTFFPKGLALSHNGEVPHAGKQTLSVPILFQGYINIFGRLLNCSVMINQPGTIYIVTENSPAPLLFAKGEIIIQKDVHSSLQGPKIVASIDTKIANVTIRGFAKILGIESDVDVSIDDNIKFTVAGKIMEYKETILTAYSTETLDRFQVYGCLENIAFQVQLLLREIISKSSNQSIVNKRKAEANYLNAQNYNEISDHEEIILRSRRDHERALYEEHLLEYGRFEVKVNDTCLVPNCEMKCFGCPRLEKCCRLDIFGHCIACSSWKTCCWKNINPLCISKQDGCNVIRTAAQRNLAEKEDEILQERIELDNLDLHVLKAEINKGKHEAVLEAAIDAKQLVEEDSSPGLNAHDAIKNFGSTNGWAKINSVCYNTSIEQASTGCMNFLVAAELFKTPEQNLSIWSCLKDDLVTELAESIANMIFPNIVDTSDDGITEVAEKLNSVEIERHLDRISANQEHLPGNHLSISNNQPTILIGQKISPDKHRNVFDQQMSIQFKQEPPHPNNFGPVAPQNLANAAMHNINAKLKPPDLVYTIPGKTDKGNHFQQSMHPTQVKITNQKMVSGFLSSSGSGAGSTADLNEVDNELKSIYDTGVTAEASGEEEVDQGQPTEEYETNEISPNEEEELANEIVQDEEKEDDKLLNEPQFHTFAEADKENAKVIQNETDLMLKYQFNPKYNLVRDSDEYSIRGQRPSFYYAMKNESNENMDYDNEQEITDGQAPIVLPNEYSLDDDVLKQTLVLLHQQPERDKREVNSIQSNDDEAMSNIHSPSLILPNEFTLDSDLMEETHYRYRRQADEKPHSGGFNNREDLMTETKAPIFNKQRAIRDANLDDDLMSDSKIQEDELQRYTRDTTRGKLNGDDLMSESKLFSTEPLTEHLVESVKHRSRRSIQTQKDNTGNDRIAIRLKRDLSALYEPDEYGSPGKIEVDEMFKQKLNEQHQYREKRSVNSESPNLPNTNPDPNKRMLFSKPFWDVKSDRKGGETKQQVKSRKKTQKKQKPSRITSRPSMMTGMLRKRWKIPENSNGRCHIYHQLIAICKDMADTIIMLDKSLNRSRAKFLSEDKEVYMELFDTEGYLINAAKRINISASLITEAEKTLTVVRQGVNIWSRRCTSEFDWQNQSGVQTWIQAMDYKIQELGGFGVYRFLENLFHAFQALFEVLTLGNTAAARDAIDLLHRTHRISKSFDRIFKEKLSVTHSRIFANDILSELEHLRKDSLFC